MDPWKKINEEPLFEGLYRCVKRVRYELPGGYEKDFDILLAGEVVILFPLTPEGKLVLVQQFRPGPEQVLTELPGGWRDSEESLEEAARREFLEETGYTGSFHYVGCAYGSAYSDLRRHVFVVLNCKKVADPASDEDECLETVLMDVPAFRQHLWTGQLCDIGSPYLALDFLGLLDSGRREWAAATDPTARWGTLRRILGASLTGQFIGRADSTIRRYWSGMRTPPSDVMARLDFLAEVVAHLRYSYTYEGVRRWFFRERSADLGGKSPVDLLEGTWSPQDASPQRILALAAASRDMVAT